jgi:tryptophan synthase alpha chain
MSEASRAVSWCLRGAASPCVGGMEWGGASLAVIGLSIAAEERGPIKLERLALVDSDVRCRTTGASRDRCVCDDETAGSMSAMGRISATFEAARHEGRGVVMPFITGGDPSIPSTLALIDALARAGAGAVEIGIPFSDPIADGPVIAASMYEALQRGVTPQAIFDALRQRRDERFAKAAANAAGARVDAPDVPAVAMVSMSIVHRIGVDRFIDELASVGVDGIIVPDADLGSAGGISKRCERHDLACAFLVAPTSKPDRVRAIVELCRGFVYLLARAGITGETQVGGAVAGSAATPVRASASVSVSGSASGAASGVASGAASAPASEAGAAPAIRRQIDAIRSVNPTIPIAAGFGIATPDHVRAILSEADGAIVGSALVRRIQDAVRSGSDPIAEAEAFVRTLVAAAATARAV